MYDGRLILDEEKGGLGLDIGSREGSHIPLKSTDSRRRPNKRSREDEDAQSDSEDDQETKANGPHNPISTNGSNPRKGQMDLVQDPINTLRSDPVEPEADEPAYCFCKQVSYGEMIGCDDEECENEWVSWNPACRLGSCKEGKG